MSEKNIIVDKKENPHEKVPINSSLCEKEESYSTRKRKISILNNSTIKPHLITSKSEHSQGNSDSTTDTNKKNSKKLSNKHKDDFLNINDIILTSENISKEEEDRENPLNFFRSKNYVTLHRLINSRGCIKFYIALMTISIMILLYSVIGYFFHVSKFNRITIGELPILVSECCLILVITIDMALRVYVVVSI